MTLIGLVARKQNGKDTVFEFIQGCYPRLDVTRMAYADPLYQEVARATGLTIEFIKAHKENFRLILQGWGTDYRRKICSDSYWLDKMAVKLSNSNADIVIVTDVRFLNEAKLIVDVGGHLVRIVRPGLPSDDQHQSETEMDKIMVDHVITNDGSLGELREDVRECLRVLRKRGKEIKV